MRRRLMLAPIRPNRKNFCGGSMRVHNPTRPFFRARQQKSLWWPACIYLLRKRVPIVLAQLSAWSARFAIKVKIEATESDKKLLLEKLNERAS